MVKIFISHSSRDAQLANKLVNLLRSALHLKSVDIRCTSLNGYRLPAGANTDETLRQEVLAAEVVIGLISEASIDSAYVLFELGARWGAGKYLIPVLDSGHNVSMLRGPIAKLNALCCDQAAQLHQLIDEVAKVLKLEHDRELPAVYEKDIGDVLTCASVQPLLPPSLGMPREPIPNGTGPIWALSSACLLVGTLGSSTLFGAITAEKISTTATLIIPSIFLGWAFYRTSREIITRLRRRNHNLP